jgi:DegV family protein with EDD domain
MIAVVTDSTSCLDDPAALGVQVVPLRVQLGDWSGLDGVEVSAEQVRLALQRGEIVTTSRPAPEEFRLAYQRLFDAGAAGIVSVQLSSKLSGTYEAAQLAAAEFGDAVQVVDSGTIAMGLGFAVQAAVASASAGGDLAAVCEAALQTVRESTVTFYVDSLEWLRRGGRIGSSAARFGTALSMKPLLRLEDGQIVAAEKVRTASKALARLVDQACAAAGSDPVRVVVHHLGAADRAAQVSDQLRARLPRLQRLDTSEVGGVLAAHVGPGLIGIVLRRG